MAAWRANKKILRKDAKALSWVVNSFKTQMAPMITDVPPLVTRTVNSNCHIAAISAFNFQLSAFQAHGLLFHLLSFPG